MKPTITIINLTPHAITLVSEQGNPLATFAPSGGKARVQVHYYPTQLGNVLGLPTTSSCMGEIEGLPEAREGVYYIASQIVATAAVAKGRADVLHPGELVRDDRGQPIGCRTLNFPQ